MENDTEVLQALAKALGPYLQGQGHPGPHTPYGLDVKAAGVPSNTAYLYEGGGLFGRCDGPSVLVNAMVGPIGFEKALTWVGNDTEKEFVDAWKAVEEYSSNEQATVCGDCIKISLKACAQYYCFGRFCRQTDELQFDRLSMKANANVPVRTLFGAVTDANNNVLIPNGTQITDAFMLQTRGAAYLLRLKNSTMLWNGNPVNNVGNAYQEYMGFDLVINTGKFDAYTQLDCDSIDSFMMDMDFNNPTTDGAYSLPNWYRRMVLQFMRRAEGAGFDWNSATMYIVMSPNQWDCAARVYACTGIDLCNVTGDNSEFIVSADEARRRYEDFLSRLALPIYGRWYPVVLDSQIVETTGQANGICSDHYFITTEINGEAITYGEYQDFNKTYGSIRQEMVSMFGSDDIAITDNGRFALIRDNERGCFDVQIYTKPRIVSVAPWLSGRIQNVCCDILQSPLPDVTGSGRVYELDGGRTTTPVPTIYGDCLDC